MINRSGVDTRSTGVFGGSIRHEQLMTVGGLDLSRPDNIFMSVNARTSESAYLHLLLKLSHECFCAQNKKNLIPTLTERIMARWGKTQWDTDSVVCFGPQKCSIESTDLESSDANNRSTEVSVIGN